MQAAQPGPTNSQPGVVVRGRRLILHFDLNNTIIIKDAAKNINSVNHCVSHTFLSNNLPLGCSSDLLVDMGKIDGCRRVWPLNNSELAFGLRLVVVVKAY